MTARPRVLLVEPGRLDVEFEKASGRGVARRSFELPESPWDASDTVCVAAVTADTAELVVRAVRRGAQAVVAVPDEAWSLPLVRDLARLGEVVVGAEDDDPLDVLNDDQRELLRRLSDGQTIPEAAAELFLSVRTAERRLGAARRLLGVRTTAEAVVLAGSGA